MPTIADVCGAINALQTDGVVENYAIGGTMAALFYAEATRTFEVLVGASGLNRDSLQSWAQKHECEYRDEQIMLFGVPVRLAEPETEELKIAIVEAQILEYDGVGVRVMSAEALMAACEADRKSLWGYDSAYFGAETSDDDSPDAQRFAAKRRWHQSNARLPVKEKVTQLLQMQKQALPLLARHRALNGGKNRGTSSLK